MDSKAGSPKKREAAALETQVGLKDPRRVRLDREEALNCRSIHHVEQTPSDRRICEDDTWDETPTPSCEERYRDSNNEQERHSHEEVARESNSSSDDMKGKTHSSQEDRREHEASSEDEDEDDEGDFDYDSEEDRLAQETFEQDNSCNEEQDDNDHTLDTIDMLSDDESEPRDTEATDPMNLGWSLWKDVVNIQLKIAEKFPHEGTLLEAYEEFDMAILAGLFKCHHADFVKMGKKSRVDIGYHFTQFDNLKSITKGGLLSKPERAAQNITSFYRGSAKGEGIYTANDTSHGASGTYGEIGLLVARLRGVEVSPPKCNNTNTYDDHDTCVCNNVVVLHHSAQCLVLMKFERPLLTERCGPQAIDMAHSELQKLMDKFFPEEKSLHCQGPL